MKLNYLPILIIAFSSFNTFSQEKTLYTKDLCSLFFNLDLELPDSTLSNQILNIPDYRFKSTDKMDTVWFNNKESFVLFKTPEIIGMPNFYARHSSIDPYHADSLFIFLGGGGGIQMNDHDLDATIEYTIETIEVIREYQDANAAFNAINALRNELNKLRGNQTEQPLVFAPNPYFEWSTELDLSEEEKSNYLSKTLELRLLNPNEAISNYSVILIFAKSILN